MNFEENKFSDYIEEDDERDSRLITWEFTSWIEGLLWGKKGAIDFESCSCNHKVQLFAVTLMRRQRFIAFSDEKTLPSGISVCVYIYSVSSPSFLFTREEFLARVNSNHTHSRWVVQLNERERKEKRGTDVTAVFLHVHANMCWRGVWERGNAITVYQDIHRNCLSSRWVEWSWIRWRQANKFNYKLPGVWEEREKQLTHRQR